MGVTRPLPLAPGPSPIAAPPFVSHGSVFLRLMPATISWIAPITRPGSSRWMAWPLFLVVIRLPRVESRAIRSCPRRSGSSGRAPRSEVITTNGMFPSDPAARASSALFRYAARSSAADSRCLGRSRRAISASRSPVDVRNPWTRQSQTLKPRVVACSPSRAMCPGRRTVRNGA